MRRPRRAGGAFARALLVLLLLALLIGSAAVRVGPVAASGRAARNRQGGRAQHNGRAAVPMVVRTRPLPVRVPPEEEESKRRIPSCPDPLHNRR
jgi:hypothetical protein